jgi:hypothetical protein
VRRFFFFPAPLGLCFVSSAGLVRLQISKKIELLSPRNAQKRDKQIQKMFPIFCRFFGKSLSTRTFWKHFLQRF